MSDTIDFEGMTATEAALALGKPLSTAKTHLYHRGYRYRHGRYRLQQSVYEVEDEIAARSPPPAEPCWRCGARQGCEHR